MVATEAARAKAFDLSAAEAAYWFACLLMPLYALFIAVPIPFANDGFVYISMVSALIEHGSLAFANGYEEYGSETLYTFQYVPTERGLMPQYPSGWAFLAAPFYALGGIRGLFLLNALATVLTLWLIRVTGRVLFGDDAIGRTAALLYAFATFAFDYAGDVWPHAVAIAFMMGGMAAAVLAWRDDDLRWALAAGLVLGLGLNVRVDMILPAAAIGCWFLAVAARPYRMFAVLIAAMVPGLLIAAGLNLMKFDVFNPISYGRGPDGGATSITGYGGLLPLLALSGLGALALGLRPVRQRLRAPRVLGAVAAAALVAVALVPPLADMTERVLRGAAGLLLGMEHLSHIPLASTLPDGSVWYAGRPKKALVESMPYLAVIVALLPRVVRGPGRSGVALCLLVALMILLPFAYKSWVGGAANHMRYLLHLTPALVILAAVALRGFETAPRRLIGLGAIVGVAVALLAFVLARMRGQVPLYALQSEAAGALAAAVALFALGAVLLGGRVRGAASAMLHGAAWAGIIGAGLSTWGADFLVHRDHRAARLPLLLALRAVPEDALVVGENPNWTYERVAEPRTLIAIRKGEEPYDAVLLARAFAEGKTVVVQHVLTAKAMVEAGDAGSVELLVPGKRNLRLYRATPPS